MEDRGFAGSSFDTPSKGRGRRRFILIAGAVVLVLILVFGVYTVFLAGDDTSPSQDDSISLETQPVDIPEEEAPPEEETPTPTEEAAEELDRSELSIEVLNGSGVAGAAGDVAAKLRELGYTIASTGNADNFDYEGLEIQITEENEDYLPQLRKDLEKDYTISDTSTLTATSSADAVVIVGS